MFGSLNSHAKPGIFLGRFLQSHGDSHLLWQPACFDQRPVALQLFRERCLSGGPKNGGFIGIMWDPTHQKELISGGFT